MFEGTMLITSLASGFHCRWGKEAGSKAGEGGCVHWAAVFAPEKYLYISNQLRMRRAGSRERPAKDAHKYIPRVKKRH